MTWTRLIIIAAALFVGGNLGYNLVIEHLPTVTTAVVPKAAGG